MATQYVCRSCVRSLARRDHQVATSLQRRAAQHSRRSYSAAPPAALYLDFLAPSWQHAQALTQQPIRKPQMIQQGPVLLQRRGLSVTPPRQEAQPITNPRHDASGNLMTITITPRAAHRLQTISETDENPSLALRVSVESGGCHGFQYLMSLIHLETDVDAEEDTVFEEEKPARGTGGYKAKVVMDEASLDLLRGSNIDYTMELIGSQFKVTGIPGAKSSCGCGTSFDIAV